MYNYSELDLKGRADAFEKIIADNNYAIVKLRNDIKIDKTMFNYFKNSIDYMKSTMYTELYEDYDLDFEKYIYYEKNSELMSKLGSKSEIEEGGFYTNKDIQYLNLALYILFGEDDKTFFDASSKYQLAFHYNTSKFKKKNNSGFILLNERTTKMLVDKVRYQENLLNIIQSIGYILKDNYQFSDINWEESLLVNQALSEKVKIAIAKLFSSLEKFIKKRYVEKIEQRLSELNEQDREEFIQYYNLSIAHKYELVSNLYEIIPEYSRDISHFITSRCMCIGNKIAQIYVNVDIEYDKDLYLIVQNREMKEIIKTAHCLGNIIDNYFKFKDIKKEADDLINLTINNFSKNNPAYKFFESYNPSFKSMIDVNINRYKVKMVFAKKDIYVQDIFFNDEIMSVNDDIAVKEQMHKVSKDISSLISSSLIHTENKLNTSKVLSDETKFLLTAINEFEKIDIKNLIYILRGNSYYDKIYDIEKYKESIFFGKMKNCSTLEIETKIDNLIKQNLVCGTPLNDLVLNKQNKSLKVHEYIKEHIQKYKSLYNMDYIDFTSFSSAKETGLINKDIDNMGDFINTFIYNCISISQISELIKLATNNIKFIDHQDVENLIAFIEQRYAMYKKCEDLFLDFCTSKIPSKYAGVFLLKAKFSKNESSPMLEYIGTALSESSNVDAWHEILNSVTDEKVKKEIIESKKNVPIITQKTLSKKETNKIFSFNKMFEDEEW